MDVNNDITFRYIARLRHHSNELELVVQGHLLIEFVLNEMIRSGLKSPRAIIDDHRSYTFAIKAQLLFACGLLPEHIFRNVKRINSIRNHLAHNLEWDRLKLDYRFTRADGTALREVDLSRGRTNRTSARKTYIKLLCFGTLSAFRNHYFEKYGSFPSPALLP